MNCLLVLRDPNVRRIVSGMLSGFRIDAQVEGEPSHALEMMRHKKYDAVIVNCGDFHDGPEVLAEMRNLPLNKKCIAFAIVPADTNGTLRNGVAAHLIMKQPLSTDLMTRSLRAAHSFMTQERRRYFRCPVTLPTTVARSGGDEERGVSANISAGGMALRLPKPLPMTWTGKVKFDLPGTRHPIVAQGQIAWADSRVAGIRFTKMADPHREAVEDFLAARFAEQ
jgi:PilZ domain